MAQTVEIREGQLDALPLRPFQHHRNRRFSNMRNRRGALFHEQVEARPRAAQQDEKQRDPQPFSASKREQVQRKNRTAP